ncbi:hypothetical protein B0J14DRAFT_661214 [Halenospora varia]|nr:hypothetical protein B0J14DRAFT_661214 [Halenospora varia]
MHFAKISLLLPLLPYVLAAAINASSAVAARAVGDDPDCVWARKYSSTTYLDCQSTINYPQFVIQAGRLSDPDKRPSLTYRILLGGTGQNVKSWCDGILATINKACGPRLITPLGCKTSNEYTTLALDGDDDWKMVKNPGLDLSFQLQYGRGQSFSGSDHDHACMGWLSQVELVRVSSLQMVLPVSVRVTCLLKSKI